MDRSQYRMNNTGGYKTMKNLILICLLLNLNACGLDDPVRPVQKWGPEIEIYYTDSMYDHPEIIENIERVFYDNVSKNVELDFYECSGPGKYVVVFDYVAGENHSTVGKCEKPFVNISSDSLSVTYHLIFNMLGLVNSGDFFKPNEDHWVELKNMYGSRLWDVN